MPTQNDELIAKIREAFNFKQKTNFMFKNPRLKESAAFESLLAWDNTHPMGEKEQAALALLRQYSAMKVKDGLVGLGNVAILAADIYLSIVSDGSASGLPNPSSEIRSTLRV